jgi:hypothetical protein
VTTSEREITARVALTEDDGRLRADAVGFARTPLHVAELHGPWGRQKRWDYWCVQTPDAILQVTVAHLDYLGIVDVSFVDLRSRAVASAVRIVPFARGLRLPRDVEGGLIAWRADGLELAIEPGADGTRIVARCRTSRGPIDADVVVIRPPGEESLNVVVPWSERRYQLTSKHVARPARGRIAALGAEHAVDPEQGGFGALDYGRGVWPASTTWNWGTAACHVPGVGRVGVQLGGAWTDGTGSTENGVLVEGKLDKIGADLRWRYDARDFMRPWRISDAAGEVDLTFTPAVLRRSRVELLVARSVLHLSFGHWSGTVRAFGRPIAIDRALGWAEEHRARW